MQNADCFCGRLESSEIEEGWMSKKAGKLDAEALLMSATSEKKFPIASSTGNHAQSEMQDPLDSSDLKVEGWSSVLSGWSSFAEWALAIAIARSLLFASPWLFLSTSSVKSCHSGLLSSSSVNLCSQDGSVRSVWAR